MAAEHAREAVEREHRALAGAAAGDDVVCRAGVEQDGGEDAVLNIGQGRLTGDAVHAVIVDLVAHRGDDLFERGFDGRVLGGLAVFVDQSDAHNGFLLTGLMA